jgi:threonine/homoserine/homoserine lactone efflux protein
MFSKGQIIFAVLFFVSFVVAMIWAYRKDKAINTLLYKDSYKVILVVLMVFIILFGVVKLKPIFFP